MSTQAPKNQNPKQPQDSDSEQHDQLAKKLPFSAETARFMSAGIQLVSVVGGMALLGYWIDKWTGSDKHWFLLGGAVLGIISGLVNLIRTYLKS